MLRQLSYTELLGKSESHFIKQIAERFPAETKLLSGEMQTSPGITHDLAKGFGKEELPSSILFKNNFLPKSKQEYDHKNYVELNRGFASAIALRQVLLGGDDNYNAFIRGQVAAVALTREQFDAMTEDYNKRSDNEKISAIYMATFNDVGKAVTVIRKAAEIKMEHDEANALVVKSSSMRKELFPGLDSLDTEIRDLICYSVGLDFNPSCFTQGEYPLYPVTQIANALKKVPKDLREAIFSLIRIEAAMDVAGVRGHQAPGGAAYNKFVHPAFVLAFEALEDLVKSKSALEVYVSYLNKNAKKFGLQEVKDLNERVTLTRVALMIRANNEVDGKIVLEAFAKLKENDPGIVKILIDELAINNLDPHKISIWMQYSPDLLRILTKENNPEQQSPVEGLMMGLKIYANVLQAARQDIEPNMCVMAQGREIIPTVRRAVQGNKEALNNLINASMGNVEIDHGVVKFKQLEKSAAAGSCHDKSGLDGKIVCEKPISKSVKPRKPTSSFFAKKVILGASALFGLGIFAAKCIHSSSNASLTVPKVKM